MDKKEAVIEYLCWKHRYESQKNVEFNSISTSKELKFQLYIIVSILLILSISVYFFFNFINILLIPIILCLIALYNNSKKYTKYQKIINDKNRKHPLTVMNIIKKYAKINDPDYSNALKTVVPNKDSLDDNELLIACNDYSYELKLSNQIIKEITQECEYLMNLDSNKS